MIAFSRTRSIALLRSLVAGRRLWATLAVLAGVVLLCRLGFWQLDRLAQRQALNARIAERMVQPPLPLSGAPIDPEALDYRRVEVRGVYDPEHEIVLRSRALNGIAGVHVVTPLRLSGSDAAVLVDRGWLPMDLAEPPARRAYAEPGEVVVQGVARRPQDPRGGPADPPLAPGQNRLDAWFRVDIARLQQQTPYPLLPLFVVQQPGPGAPELPRRVATTDLGPGSHLGYAIQWFAFAAILLVGYLATIYHTDQRIN